MTINEKIKLLETIVEGDLTPEMSKRALKEVINILKDQNTINRLMRDLIDSNHRSILKTQILVMLETKDDKVLESIKEMLSEQDH